MKRTLPSFMIGVMAVLVTFGVLTAVSAVFGQYQVFNGYGYGTCIAEQPDSLQVERTNNNRRLVFSWSEVTFSDCADTAAALYEFQIRKNDATLVTHVTGIAKNQKTLSTKILKSNLAYKFRVRAVASDGNKTDWSLYKLFRTLPKKPQQIVISRRLPTAVYASWRNVARSKGLRYYQVVVKQKRQTVFTKKVKVGLRKPRASTMITGLEPDTVYTIKIRSVYSTTYRSTFQTTTFQTSS